MRRAQRVLQKSRMWPPSSLNWCFTARLRRKSKRFLLSPLPLPIFILCWRCRLHRKRLRKPSSPASRTLPCSGSLPTLPVRSLPAVAGGDWLHVVSVLQRSCFICRQLAFLSNSDFNQFVIMRHRLTPQRRRVFRVRTRSEGIRSVAYLEKEKGDQRSFKLKVFSFPSYDVIDRV